ncbi:MAG TPA: aminodeoxychorismate/anthranilate synthase component II [Stellaceae bacterium]|nr:aminodeoxychorismate/anthranilate synthase component II [Stellaceae bacterium]
MFLLIDNYDSFTYNLWHFLGELGAEVAVRRNDKLSVAEALAMEPEGIVISPGPSDPDHAGICLDLVRAAGNTPLLGVCLGHQAIGQAFGGKIVRAPVPMHGKLSRISHDGTGVFKGFNRGPFLATRYHSLVVERQSMPACLRINAETEDGVVMGVMHRERPMHGVQFHPESIASESGHALLANFIDLARRAPLAA